MMNFHCEILGNYIFFKQSLRRIINADASKSMNYSLRGYSHEYRADTYIIFIQYDTHAYHIIYACGYSFTCIHSSPNPSLTLFDKTIARTIFTLLALRSRLMSSL